MHPSTKFAGLLSLALCVGGVPAANASESTERADMADAASQRALLHRLRSWAASRDERIAILQGRDQPIPNNARYIVRVHAFGPNNRKGVPLFGAAGRILLEVGKRATGSAIGNWVADYFEEEIDDMISALDHWFDGLRLGEMAIANPSPSRPSAVPVATPVPSIRVQAPDLTLTLPSALAVGSPLEMTLASDRHGWVNLFDLGTSGQVLQLLQDHPIRAGVPLRLPDPQNGFVYLTSPPLGVERLVAIVTDQPLGWKAHGREQVAGSGVRVLAQGWDHLSLEVLQRLQQRRPGSWRMVEERIGLMR